MSNDYDRMRFERDALIRRDILRAVDAAKVAGGMSGRMLMRLLGGPPTGPEDDQALMGLCVDLENAGLLARQDMRYRTTERQTLDNTAFAISDAGTGVLAGAARHPLVADDRIAR